MLQAVPHGLTGGRGKKKHNFAERTSLWELHSSHAFCNRKQEDTLENIPISRHSDVIWEEATTSYGPALRTLASVCQLRVRIQLTRSGGTRHNRPAMMDSRRWLSSAAANRCDVIEKSPESGCGVATATRFIYYLDHLSEVCGKIDIAIGTKQPF